MSLKPRQPVPSLAFDTVGGKHFALADAKPGNFTMVVFYRGLHCPICRKYLSELDGLLPEFEKRGVVVAVVSSDTRERAEKAQTGWGMKALDFGYGLSIEAARQWGLYVSTSRGMTSAGVEEPALFSEPGLFLVRPDGTLYWGSWSTMPFARPHFNEILAGLDFAISKDYPARGEA